MPRVIGIDPGSHVTGWGVVEGSGQNIRHVASGCIRLDENLRLGDRLAILHDEITRILKETEAEQVAVERVFVARNADSALKLGHVRGVVILAVHQSGRRAYEYAPAQVKKMTTGSGRADKHQMVQLVRLQLSLPADPAEDEADALAIAMTHVLMAGTIELFGGEVPRGRRR